jgi:hypothetical protein
VVAGKLEWVMLAYRMPREPSTPRIAVWRRLRRLGVAQPVDGLVLLPHEARTREGLEWVAERVVEAGGQATLWTARNLSAEEEGRTVQTMNAAISAEYAALTLEARAAAAEDAPTSPRDSSPAARPELRRRAAQLARTLEQVQSRDYFGAAGRVEAKRAVLALKTGSREANPERAR